MVGSDIISLYLELNLSISINGFGIKISLLVFLIGKCNIIGSSFTIFFFIFVITSLGFLPLFFGTFTSDFSTIFLGFLPRFLGGGLSIDSLGLALGFLPLLLLPLSLMNI